MVINSVAVCMQNIVQLVPIISPPGSREGVAYRPDEAGDRLPSANIRYHRGEDLPPTNLQAVSDQPRAEGPETTKILQIEPPP